MSKALVVCFVLILLTACRGESGGPASVLTPKAPDSKVSSQVESEKNEAPIASYEPPPTQFQSELWSKAAEVLVVPQGNLYLYSPSWWLRIAPSDGFLVFTGFDFSLQSQRQVESIEAFIVSNAHIDSWQLAVVNELGEDTGIPISITKDTGNEFEYAVNISIDMTKSPNQEKKHFLVAKGEVSCKVLTCFSQFSLKQVDHQITQAAIVRNWGTPKTTSDECCG